MVNTQAENPNRGSGPNGDFAPWIAISQRRPRDTNENRESFLLVVSAKTVAGLLLTVCATATIGCATGLSDSPLPSWANPGSATPNQQVIARRPDPDTESSPVIRGQNGWPAIDSSPNETSPGSGEHLRYPMPISNANNPAPTNDQSGQATTLPTNSNQYPVASGIPAAGTILAQTSPQTMPMSPPATGSTSVIGPPSSGTPGTTSPTTTQGESPWLTSPFLNGPPVVDSPTLEQMPGVPLPVNVRVLEARTGRFMFGAGVNSDAGVTGQIIVDERNFDLFGFPTSMDDIWNGEAFRGRGQGFRLEAVPGNRVQRYLVSFTEPYLFQSRISLNVSGFLYDRGYYDWTESRVGGRLGLGYRLTPDLSASAAIRAEGVRIKDPRVIGIPALDDVVGNNSLYSGRFSLRHDTRDMPFAPTQGHLVEVSYEQVFGDFEYPRAEIDYRRYFLVRERADGSGRHTISASLSAGFSGEDTPLFENYYAGGFSTLRGFAFRGAAPVESSVTVGGRFRTLGSLEYTMPLTADDMIKAVAFCDFGTVEREIDIHRDNFRVAPGFGFRIAVPALGPAPLAFDFAFPVSQADTDETQVFSFFFGMGRG